jgi:YegS/Rv2252/BmrU family lipid kinase
LDLADDVMEIRHGFLIFNPASGKGQSKLERVEGLVEDLRRRGIEAVPCPTHRPGHATDLSRRAIEQKVDLVIVWGGDGTLNEVASGMLGSQVPLGLLPGGSVNVFARATGIPLRLGKAMEALERAKPRPIPVGMAGGGRPFLLMAGIGLDAEVIRRLGAGFKRVAGALAFWIRGFSLLATYPFCPFLVRIGEQEYTATSAIAGKLPYYGGRYVLTPDATLDEPKLDVVIFQGRGGAAYLRYLAGVLSGLHLRFKDVQHVKTDRLEIEAEASIYHQLDGELAGSSSVEISVRPRALRVLLPDSGA